MAACGTDAGYQQHRALGEPACTGCCDAHAVTNANQRAQARTRAGLPVNPIQYRAALYGREPAEVLCGADRDLLWRTLLEQGWPARRIAEHTRTSTYTTGRIRERLGLSANPAVRHPAATDRPA
jgi:hypothetical protein